MMQAYHIYKINEAIKTRYQAVGAQAGITDLYLAPTNPSGVDQTPILMTEIDSGLYEASFTPDVTGRWWTKITSSGNPECASAVSYLVDDYDTLDGTPVILSDEEGHRADITPEGRLKVSQELENPPDTTQVVQTEYGNVSSSDENEYLIPSGETLVIQRLNAGAERDPSNGSVIELWYDEDGTGTSMEIIDAIFANGNSDQHDLSISILGDGTKKVRMTRRRLSGGAKEIFGRWEGYY